MSKSHMSYTLEDIIRLEGGFLKRMYTAEELIPCIDAAKYLLDLSRTAGRSIGNISAMDMGFIYEREGSLTWREGNRVFTDLCQRLDEQDDIEYGTENIEVPEEVLSTLVANGLAGNPRNTLLSQVRDELRTHSNEITDLNRDLRRAEERIDENRAKIIDKQLTMENLRESLDALVNPTENGGPSKNELVAMELTKLQQRGRWNLIGMSAKEESIDCLYFEMKDDCIMHQFNPASELDNRINFGRLRCRLKFRSRRDTHAEVFPGKKALTAGPYRHWHPNISEAGNICYGGTDVGTDLASLLVKHKIFDYLEGLANLLATYSTATPYCRHHLFVEKQDKINAKICRYGLAKHPHAVGVLTIDEVVDFFPLGSELIDPDVPTSSYTLKGLSVERKRTYCKLQTTTGSGLVLGNRTCTLETAKTIFKLKGEENETNDIPEAGSEGIDPVPSEQSSDGDTGTRQSGPLGRWGSNCDASDHVPF